MFRPSPQLRNVEKAGLLMTTTRKHSCFTVNDWPHPFTMLIHVELPRPQLAPSLYSRPGVYWLESLVYRRLLNRTGVYSEPASIRANTVLCLYKCIPLPGTVVDSEGCLNKATTDQVGKNSEDTHKKQIPSRCNVKALFNTNPFCLREYIQFPVHIQVQRPETAVWIMLLSCDKQ